MNWRRVRAVMRKDLGEIGANPMVVLPMVVVPAVLCVVLPCVILFVGLSLRPDQVAGSMHGLERLLGAYQVPEVFTEPVPRLLYVFLNYTFLPLFMLTPLMMTTLVSANAIVGEKERKTLETLLSTPLSNRELIVSKLLVSFLPAVAISWGVFAVFFGVTNAISLGLIHQLIVRSWIWLPSLLLLSPAISLVSLAVTLLVSLKAKTFQSAQQVAALVVLPLVALVYAQLAGVVVLNPVYVVAASAVLAGLGLALILRVLPRFTREAIVSTL